MIKAIFFKEWIKTRWCFFIALVVTTGMAGYSILKINKLVSLKGAGHLWEVAVTRDALFIDMLEYVPLIVGIVLAVVQFAPEMQRKCLKLTLHLPCSQKRMIFSMLAAGLTLLLTCFIVNFGVLYACLPAIFPSQLVWRFTLSAFPGYLAGVASYLMASWIILEPTWKMRIVDITISIFVISIYFLAPAPEAYNSFLPYLTIYTFMLIVLSWISVSRFKSGKQD